MTERDPFHEGEHRVQELLDEAVEARRNGRMISDEIQRGLLKYVEEQPLAVLASRDADGDPRATIVTGTPGFLTAPDTRTVDIDLTVGAIADSEPFLQDIERRPEAGILVIDLETRRRLRINGRIRRTGDRRYRLEVEESYPNCPKYIQVRRPAGTGSTGDPGDPGNAATSPESASAASRSGVTPEPHQRRWIRSADTFFVASGHPERGIDASHRGGEPGFVRFLDERTLRIPDYDGNHMYNTLGNFFALPRAGLAFPDFAGDRMRQLQGSAELRLHQEDPAGETGGTNRYWDFTIDRWREAPVDLSAVREAVESSPFNPRPSDPAPAPASP